MKIQKKNTKLNIQATTHTHTYTHTQLPWLQSTLLFCFRLGARSRSRSSSRPRSGSRPPRVIQVSFRKPITYYLVGTGFSFDFLSDHLENPRASSACNWMRYSNAHWWILSNIQQTSNSLISRPLSDCPNCAIAWWWIAPVYGPIETDWYPVN